MNDSLSVPNRLSIAMTLVAVVAVGQSQGRSAHASTAPDAPLGVVFTKIANNGSSIPDGTALGTGPTDWACTRHNASGLWFEVKVASAGNLRYADHRYSWFNNDAGGNGGQSGFANGGVCSGSSCDTAAYVAAVNSVGLCGYSNWRLPTVTELQRIVGVGTPGTGTPVVDAAFFPNLGTVPYWARSNVAGIPTHAWSVRLDDGNAMPYAKESAFRVILVR